MLAYNPKTHKMEMQPILHVWIHPDNDLVDLTITTPAKGAHNATLKATSEVVHTNQKHPFLTTEHGFLPVGQITVGMHVVRADGRIGLITRWTIVPGAKMMYNLEVARDHTFTVGVGQWVVHNCGGVGDVLSKLKEAGVNYTTHFEDQLTKRASGLTFDNIKEILVDGQRFFDKKEFNFGSFKYIDGNPYAIFHDGDKTLVSILTKSEGAGLKPGRYMPVSPFEPNPFSFLEP